MQPMSPRPDFFSWPGGKKAALPFSRAEYQRRLTGLRAIMAQHGVDGVLLTSAHGVAYYSGFLYCSFGRPYGGNVLVAAQAELIIPLPDRFASQARASVFYDIGNVFNSGEVSFTDKLGSPVEYKPEFDELKTSVGLAVQWLAPLGLFRFSYAFPLNEFKGNDRFYGDEIEAFQFSIGQAF